jgi:L-fuculose-phosphate aldolase
MMKDLRRNENNRRLGNVTHLPDRNHPAETDQNRSVTKLAFFGKLLHQRGYVSGTDGNLSVRLGPQSVLVTPRGVSKGFMRAEDMVVVNMDGHKLVGSREPSSEIGMHLRIYKLRPDIRAVVHAHPCISTGFASAGIGLIEPICSELVLTLGKVPLARYALPGSNELAKSLEPFIHDHNAILMQNHGVVTYGETLERAYMNMETVEHCARIALVTKLLGQVRTLSDYEVKQLLYSTSHKCSKS